MYILYDILYTMYIHEFDLHVIVSDLAKIGK